MRAISFSLWGNLDKYCLGAIRNVCLAERLYPEWVCVFFCDPSVPGGIMDRLADGGAMITPMIPGVPKMFQRFLISDWPDCSRYMIRDSDSRLNERELASIVEWEKSGLMFLSQRDHWAHAREINGGLCAGIRGAIPSMKQLIDDYSPDDEYGDDQTFLCRKVWPLVRHSCLQHDSVSRHLFPGSIPFPTKRNGSKRFVGEVFDIGQNGEDIPRDFDCAAIDEWKD